jgi:myo-inositol-1(or 4)-monophosphatase
MSLERTYEEVIAFVVAAGEVLVRRQGSIEDIGVKKQWLTEEDIRIERGLAEIIERRDVAHELYAEEEHETYPDSEHVWIADPISGTRLFLNGSSNYTIAVAHTFRAEVRWAAVYQPATKELYTARLHQGAFLNNERIRVSMTVPEGSKFVFQESTQWPDLATTERVLGNMKQLGDVTVADGSTAMYFCHTACGRNDGMITLAKDSYPSIVASLVVFEAGGRLTNARSHSRLMPTDRVFVAGHRDQHAELLRCVEDGKVMR